MITLEHVVSGVIGALGTVLGATWKVAQWVRDMAALRKAVEEHDARDEKFHTEAREKWDDFGRSLGRLEGAGNRDPWDEKTHPSGHGRAAR